MKWLITVAVFFAASLLVYSIYELFRKGFTEYEKRYLEKTSSLLESMFVFTDPKLLWYLNIVSIFFFGLVGFALFRSWYMVLAFMVAGWFAPRLILKYAYSRRFKKLDEQLVDGLTILANSLKAGHSLERAIEFLVQESPAPLSQEFGLVLKEYKLGVKLEEALENLTKRVPLEDYVLFVTAVNIARELGGNLPEIFDNIAFTVRERHRIENKVRALTSQGKLQGIVMGAMPLFLGIMLYMVDPTMIQPLFTTWIGKLAILAIIVLDALGVYFIMKIVKVEV